MTHNGTPLRDTHPESRTSCEKNASSSSARARPGCSGCPSTSHRNCVAVNCAAHHVALQLRHVHTIGREPAQRLVQSRRHVASRGRQTSSPCLRIRRRPSRLRRRNIEPRGVMRRVLHIGPQHGPAHRSPPPSDDAIAASSFRPHSATNCADPAVSASITACAPNSRTIPRTCPNATAWLNAPGAHPRSPSPSPPAGNAQPVGNAPPRCAARYSGSSEWISGTRPGQAVLTGQHAPAAPRQSFTASIVASNVSHGSVGSPGNAMSGRPGRNKRQGALGRKSVIDEGYFMVGGALG